MIRSDAQPPRTQRNVICFRRWWRGAWCQEPAEAVNAYQLASSFLDKELAPTIKILKRILKDNPQIRRRKRAGIRAIERLPVTAGD